MRGWADGGGGGGRRKTYVSPAWSRSVGGDLKSCKCYGRKIQAKLILIIPYQHICMDSFSFFFFFYKERVYDQWSSGTWGLFRNSQRFDLIRESKYS